MRTKLGCVNNEKRLVTEALGIPRKRYDELQNILKNTVNNQEGENVSVSQTLCDLWHNINLKDCEVLFLAYLVGRRAAGEDND